MALRFAVLLVASLAIASAADAACLTCIRTSIGDDGRCGPSNDGLCSYWCCLLDEGAPCSMTDHRYECATDGPVAVPAVYFASKLPLVTEGSAVRLRLGKAKPIDRKCGAALIARVKS